MKFKVRKANLDDLDQLVKFIAAEADEAEGVSKSPDTIRNGIKSGLENPDIACYWVIESADGDLIGSVSVVKEWSDWNCAFYWWIQSMYIIPNHRGQRLMEALLETVKHSARKEKALELRLYVHAGNKRAIRAYQKAGFSDTNYKMMTSLL